MAQQPEGSAETSTPLPVAAEAAVPDRVRSRAITGLFVLALFYTAYFAGAVLVPVTIALLLNLVLAPVVRFMKRRLRIPLAVGAVMVVLGLAGAVAAAFYALSTPAADWMNRLPLEMVEIEQKLHLLQAPVKEMQEAAKQVERLTETGEQDKLAVVVKGPSLVQTLLGGTKTLSIGAGLTIVLLLFLLASGDSLLRQAVAAAPNLRDKKLVVHVVRETELEISRYLLTVSIINTLEGIAVGLAMWALGMPNPALWGVLAGLLNYIPYLGGLITVSVISLVALITFDSPIEIILPPLAYLTINTLEGQVLTPALVAHRLVLSPVAVMLSLILWSWMWGIGGALLAVPLLATFKIVCDRVAWLEPVGILLARPIPPEESEPAHVSAGSARPSA